MSAVRGVLNVRQNLLKPVGKQRGMLCLNLAIAIRVIQKCD